MCSVELQDGRRVSASNPSELPLKRAVEGSFLV